MNALTFLSIIVVLGLVTCALIYKCTIVTIQFHRVPGKGDGWSYAEWRTKDFDRVIAEISWTAKCTKVTPTYGSFTQEFDDLVEANLWFIAGLGHQFYWLNWFYEDFGRITRRVIMKRADWNRINDHLRSLEEAA